VPTRRAGKWVRRMCCAAALLLPAGCGVHNFWDTVTSRDLTWHEKLWAREDPLETVRLSSDGAKRGKALAKLRDPRDQATRESYLQILTTAALDDAEPMCRLGAIRALGSYRDPRAVRVLEQVYQARLPFIPEHTSIIRQQTLAALEEIGIPEARETLVLAAKQPGSQGSSLERQQIIDERLQAIRALRRFKDYASADALMHVLETEKDVALRHRATESLQELTGKNLPAEARAWREAFNQQNVDVAGRDSVIDRVMWRRRD
jgi:HEAT repeat protein